MTSSPPAVETAGATAHQPRHRVFLVEDHPIVRDGLAQLINDEPDLVVCGVGDDIDTSLREIGRSTPDVVVVDLLLADGDGLDLVRAVRDRFPQVRSLVLSMYAESLYAERSLRAGARGYVAKLAPTDTVIVAIRRVLSGEIYVSESVATRLFTKLVGGDGAPPAAARGAARDPTATRDLASLSDREFQVFRLMGQGLGPTEIAARLGVSVKTVETYKDHLKRKLGLYNGRDLLRRAVQHALEQEQVSPPSPRAKPPASPSA
jgi:DNA-binding NarL/FixJ family response regulator